MIVVQCWGGQMRTRLLQFIVLGAAFAWVDFSAISVRAQGGYNNCTCSGSVYAWKTPLQNPDCGTYYYGPYGPYSGSDDYACLYTCQSIMFSASDAVCDSVNCQDYWGQPSGTEYRGCWQNSDNGHSGCFGPTINYCWD